MGNILTPASSRLRPGFIGIGHYASATTHKERSPVGGLALIRGFECTSTGSAYHLSRLA
ncbi:MAG: hypothetical protein NWR72_12170 [Bacteroidia bacterium]|nr:hypothetical protein [Bacteroidia bacterium]